MYCGFWQSKVFSLFGRRQRKILSPFLWLEGCWEVMYGSVAAILLPYMRRATGRPILTLKSRERRVRQKPGVLCELLDQTIPEENEGRIFHLAELIAY